MGYNDKVKVMLNLISQNLQPESRNDLSYTIQDIRFEMQSLSYKIQVIRSE